VLDADQRLVREHNTKPKRVVHRISLPDLDPVVWVEELYERREIQACRPRADDRDLKSRLRGS